MSGVLRFVTVWCPVLVPLWLALVVWFAYVVGFRRGLKAWEGAVERGME